MDDQIKQAAEADAHTPEIISGTSPETGSPFWLDGTGAELEPTGKSLLSDLYEKFPNFQDEWLRDLPTRFGFRKHKGKPFNIFETGGTTGMPKQRIGWRIIAPITRLFRSLSDELSSRSLLDDGWSNWAALPLGHRALGERLDALLLRRLGPPLGQAPDRIQALTKRGLTWTTRSTKP